MKQNFILNLIRGFIRICTLFLAILVWTRYYESNLTKALILSAVATFLLDTALHLIHKKMQGKQALSKKQQELCENIALEFMLSSPEKVADYFFSLVSKTVECHTQDNMILTHSKEFPVVLVPFYKSANFVFEHLLQVIQKTQALQPKRVIVCTYVVSVEAKNFSRNFREYEVLLLDKQETFAYLMQPKQFYPEISQSAPKMQKTSIRGMLAGLFSFKRAKTFFVCGFVLFLGSLILRHNLYYVIMSSLLMTFSLISFLSPKWTRKKPKQLLDLG